MNVAFVGQTGDRVGGAEESLALILANLPHDISAHVILFSDGPFADRVRRLGHRVEIVPVPGALSSSTRERPNVVGALALPLVAWRLSSLLRARKIDVVYPHTVKAHFVAGVASRLAGLPCVAHYRDILEGRARTMMRLLSISCTQERIAISRAVAACYELDRTHVIRDPVDLSAYRSLPAKIDARRALGLREDVPVVAMIGRINRWKGHDRFIRIAARVRATTRAQFVIIGEPVFRDADFVGELHAMVDELGLRDDVIFLPWQSDVPAAYAAMDVHCNCSTREPLGRTTMEAAAAGVPTVCFEDGGAAEALASAESGTVVPSGDEAAFADAVAAYLNDSALRARASASAIASLGSYAVDTHVAAIADVLRRVAA